MGESILDALEDLERKIVIVDFDPDIVKKLKNRKAGKLFGDTADSDIKEKAKIHEAYLIISTIPDMEDKLQKCSKIVWKNFPNSAKKI